MTTPPADGMPTTRGTNFYLVDPNLAFVCATVMRSDDFAHARPQLAALPALVDWTPIPAEALAEPAGGG
jgi:hypothetical protein